VHDQPLANALPRDSAASLAAARFWRERFAGAEAVYTNFVHNDLDALAPSQGRGAERWCMSSSWIQPGLPVLDDNALIPHRTPRSRQ